MIGLRFLGVLCLVLAILASGVGEWTASASTDSTPGAVQAALTQPLNDYGSRSAAHPGHMAAHRLLPKGDTSSVLCQLLCAMAVSHTAVATLNGFHEGPLNHAWIAAVGGVEPDEVAPGLQPAPPR